MKGTSTTHNPPVHRLLTGYFQRRLGYFISRPGGTNDWLLIYTIRGGGDFGHGRGTRAGGRLTTRPGDAVLLAPAALHDYRVNASAGRWDLLWAHFHPRPEWRAWLDWPAASSESPGLMRVSIQTVAERRTVERALRRMNHFAVGAERLRTSLAMNALEEALLWCARQTLRPVDFDPRIEQAEAYLCQNLRQAVTLTELAEAVGLSGSRLSHLFKRHVGVTPLRYHEVQRLERARQLLEVTNLPIKSIATEIGFDNPFYFTLRFKRYTGKGPRAYRTTTHTITPRETAPGVAARTRPRG